MPDAKIEGTTVRPARPDELSAVLTLLRDAKLPLQGVAESFDKFMVSECDGVIVGTAGLEVLGDDALLRSVAVASDWRGRGVGGALTEAILHAASAAGIRNVYLLTETASNFFPRYGFDSIARDAAGAAVQQSAEFASLCPSSAIVMKRTMR